MTTTTAMPADCMRVVLWGTCDTSKPRVRILLDGLRANGIEVLECRRDVWGGIQDKSQMRGFARWFRQMARMALAYPVLAWQYARLPRHAWVLLGYPAIPDIFVIRLLAWLRGVPVALDWFLSAYDTVVCDRGLVGRHHPLAWLLWLAEWCAIRLADKAFMDTRAHARRMEALFGLHPGSCGSVWVGVEDRVFTRLASIEPARVPGTPLRVLFYGQFIPLHGVPTIIEAARLLRGEPVDWLIIGRGQDDGIVRKMLADDPLPRVRWIDWVAYDQLPGHIHASDLCLGIFGTSEKAACVIPNKVFQALAAGKPLLTRDSPAIRELLHPASCESFPQAGMPTALANAIMRHVARPGTMTAVPVQPFHPAAIGRQLAHLLAMDANAPQEVRR